MTLDELISAFRDDENDTELPYMWSDAFITRHLNEAQREACRRAQLLVDSSSSFCTESFEAGDPLIKLNPLIITARRVKVSYSTYSLSPARAAEMDRINPGWEKHRGTPTQFITDYETGYIRLYPNPTVSGEVTMTVVRLPKDDLANGEDTPELREEYQLGLLHWVKMRAYSKMDADRYDPQKADKFEAKFVQEFGERKSARSEAWQREQPQIEVPTIA